jgi:hypothetical protein
MLARLLAAFFAGLTPMVGGRVFEVIEVWCYFTQPLRLYLQHAKDVGFGRHSQFMEKHPWRRALMQD